MTGCASSTGMNIAKIVSTWKNCAGKSFLFDKGYLTVLQVPGAFDEPRELMGEEELCIACYE